MRHAEGSRWMPRSRRARRAAILCALLAAAMTGCAPRHAGPPTLRWVVDPNPIRAEQIALFRHKRPDVTVVNDPDAGPQRVLTQLAGGVPPDVFAIYNPQSSALFARKDVLEDLRPWVQRAGIDMNAFWPQLDPFIYENGDRKRGRILGFPDNCGAMVLFYNRRLFAEAGVAPPNDTWNWDDLIRAAKRLTKRENGRITQFGIVQPPTDLIEMMTWQKGGDWFTPDGKRCLIDSPAAQGAFDLWASLRIKHHVAPSASEEQSLASLGGWGGSLNLFKAEKAAMVISGRWLIIEFRKNKELHYEIAPVPRDQYRVAMLGSKIYAIPRASRNKALAFEFLKHLISREDAMLIAGYGDGIPSVQRYCETEEYRFNPKYPDERTNDLYLTEMPHARSRQMSQWIQQLDVDTIRDEECDRIWQGEVTPAQAARNVARRINTIIRRNCANPNLMD